MNTYPEENEEIWEQLIAEGKRLQILLALKVAFQSPSLSRKVAQSRATIAELLRQLP